MATDNEILCPSAFPEWEGARLFAVVGGTCDRPETAYLDQSQPVDPEWLALAGPVTPIEIFRFAAPCAAHACQQYDAEGGTCRLAQKTSRLAPIVVHKLPRCTIRAGCRWWVQEGAAACQRCPQVATLNFAPSEAMRIAANPQITSPSAAEQAADKVSEQPA